MKSLIFDSDYWIEWCLVAILCVIVVVIVAALVVGSCDDSCELQKTMDRVEQCLDVGFFTREECIQIAISQGDDGYIPVIVPR